MSLILIVGKSYSGITNRLKEAGHEYIVLRDRTTNKHPEKKYKRQIFGDFTSHESLISSIDTLAIKPDAVITIYENYIIAATQIAEHLGLPGMPTDTALVCTDKWLMRQAFSKAPEQVNPDFTIVRNEADITSFASTHSFPLMLKPANLVKSLLISKSSNIGELLDSYRHTQDIIDETYAKYAPGRQPTIIIEEFLPGPLHTVAGFADANGIPHIMSQIADLQTARDIGFDDNFLYSRKLPSALTEKNRQAIIRTAKAGMVALGMRSSPAHIEIILTPKGPKIIEIGARLGGYRERMYDLSYGINMIDAAVAVALGKQPALKESRSDASAVIEIFPKITGRFTIIENAEHIESLPSCVSFTIKARPGSMAGRAADGYKFSAVIVLHNSDKKQLNADLSFITDNVRAKTDPAI